jgi:hypothetical protein
MPNLTPTLLIRLLVLASLMHDTVVALPPVNEQWRVGVYVVSFSEDVLLSALVASLVNSTDAQGVTLTIINTNRQPLSDRLSKPLPPQVHVHNALSSRLSVGHSTRHYNEALTHGFDNLGAPELDLVVTVQADTRLCPDWLLHLRRAHAEHGCALVQVGQGDQLLSYSVDAVRSLGLWDERLIGIAVHEGDFFIRSLLGMPNATCLHDRDHLRIWRPVKPRDGPEMSDFAAAERFNSKMLCESPQDGWVRWRSKHEGNGQQTFAAADINEERGAENRWAEKNWDYFHEKWGQCNLPGVAWAFSAAGNSPNCKPLPVLHEDCLRSRLKQTLMYPRFEANVSRFAPGYPL